ncbi:MULTISPECIES: hypothetical protein [unclassified Streptomyces]|uniref:hypothetical protein n=1 Tax=unclassified Streptomyces TaxID=2593676 RepID=UPI00344EA8EF
MAQISEPGTEPSWTVEHDEEVGTVTVTAESQMTDRAKATAEVVVPVAADGAAELEAAPVVTVTVTDPRTDEVLVESVPEVAETAEDVTRMAASAKWWKRCSTRRRVAVRTPCERGRGPSWRAAEH